MQIISANRLIDGVVVYLTGTGDWSEDVAKAAIADTPDTLEHLQNKAEEAVRENHVVGVAAGTVALEGGIPRPVKNIDRIRSLGPSVRPDLGKQAAAGQPVNAAQ